MRPSLSATPLRRVSIAQTPPDRKDDLIMSVTGHHCTQRRSSLCLGRYGQFPVCGAYGFTGYLLRILSDIGCDERCHNPHFEYM